MTSVVVARPKYDPYSSSANGSVCLMRASQLILVAIARDAELIAGKLFPLSLQDQDPITQAPLSRQLRPKWHRRHRCLSRKVQTRAPPRWNITPTWTPRLRRHCCNKQSTLPASSNAPILSGREVEFWPRYACRRNKMPSATCRPCSTLPPRKCRSRRRQHCRCRLQLTRDVSLRRVCPNTQRTSIRHRTVRVQ